MSRLRVSAWGWFAWSLRWRPHTLSLGIVRPVLRQQAPPAGSRSSEACARPEGRRSQLCDVTTASGIRFRHNNGASQEVPPRDTRIGRGVLDAMATDGRTCCSSTP